ncbi:outer membrane protein [Methylobacterium sp. Leaf118]|uniref:outer membrane protein n=1 Tax=Methylobacterium sp. Leaf118 TaxID=2876562 RepID=UPI001E603ACD|nr:outer membrane beta-barrel protein [Methylobacterium sp. Leaf118]
MPEWTGAYFGVNVGAAAGGAFHATTAVPKSGIDAEASLGGFTVGGTIGYNHQFAPGGGVVIGFEADGGYASFVAQAGASAPGLGFDAKGGLNSEPYVTTVRGRVGYAFGPILVYATGGWGASSIGASGSATVPGISLPKEAQNLPDSVKRHFPFGGYSGSSSSSVPIDGYVVGGGVEYAINPSWSVKSEYLYADLSRTGTVRIGGVTQKVEVGYDVHQVRVGLNHRLTWF